RARRRRHSRLARSPVARLAAAPAAAYLPPLATARVAVERQPRDAAQRLLGSRVAVRVLAALPLRAPAPVARRARRVPGRPAAHGRRRRALARASALSVVLGLSEVLDGGETLVPLVEDPRHVATGEV